MLEYLKTEANRARTENGAAAHRTTGSDCLDLFATIGAMRGADEGEIIARFVRAYAEDPDAAMKLLFYARDIRGGLGERRVFRTILHWLADNEPAAVKKNLGLVAEYGRWDDVLCLMDTACERDMFRLLRRQFYADMEALRQGGKVSLLAKWLPSVNASSAETVKNAKRVARAFGLDDAAYRKALVALRASIRILENNLRERDYTFDYEKQPSRALFKYKAAFWRNDKQRYRAFLTAAAEGKAVLHADNVAPYELVQPCLTDDWKNGFMRKLTPEEKASLNATWEALPDFGGEENALAVIDTSGSMYYWESKPLPAAVALSLGLYFAERNRGAFANHFIEFSAQPQLVELKGKTFADRLRYASTFCEVANTNMEAVFDLILDTAVKNHLPQKDLPARLVILSDMEFDACVEDASATCFAHAREKFAACGYRLPAVVFWNVASRNRQQPVTMNEQGVALVSGVTPRLFEMIAADALDPYAFMMEVLASDRYAPIAA